MNVIATSKKIYHYLPQKLKEEINQEFFLIDNKKDLNLDRLTRIKPRYIFFPHWSFLIPEEIYQKYECIIFHMTDVPFGRGGSPLQNLIARGVYETKVSAIRCVGDLDAGPVYMKEPLSLHGAAEEIYIRSAAVIERMIVEIIEKKPVPVPQTGDVVAFKRRKPEDGNMAKLLNLDQVYDYIRMLDAEDYPNAFLETEHLRLEFQRASRKDRTVIADVRIMIKEDRK